MLANVFLKLRQPIIYDYNFYDSYLIFNMWYNPNIKRLQREIEKHTKVISIKLILQDLVPLSSYPISDDKDIHKDFMSYKNNNINKL